MRSEIPIVQQSDRGPGGGNDKSALGKKEHNKKAHHLPFHHITALAREASPPLARPTPRFGIAAHWCRGPEAWGWCPRACLFFYFLCTKPHRCYPPLPDDDGDRRDARPPPRCAAACCPAPGATRVNEPPHHRSTATAPHHHANRAAEPPSRQTVRPLRRAAEPSRRRRTGAPSSRRVASRNAA